MALDGKWPGTPGVSWQEMTPEEQKARRQQNDELRDEAGADLAGRNFAESRRGRAHQNLCPADLQPKSTVPSNVSEIARVTAEKNAFYKELADRKAAEEAAKKAAEGEGE